MNEENPLDMISAAEALNTKAIALKTKAEVIRWWALRFNSKMKGIIMDDTSQVAFTNANNDPELCRIKEKIADLLRDYCARSMELAKEEFDKMKEEL